MTTENLFHELASMAEKRGDPPIKGQWFNIRWTPDLATGEVLNLGVVFIEEESKQVSLRTLDNFSRLHCLYSGNMESDCRFLLKVVEQSLKANSYDSPSTNIQYSAPKWAQGQTVDEILDDLYATTVTLKPTEREVKEEDAFRSKKTEKLVYEIYDQIKERSGFFAERIIPPTLYFDAERGDGKRPLFLPLRGADHLGTIVSNVYLTRATNEMNILKANRDLETARHVRRETQFGMFIQKPIIPLTHKNYDSLTRQMDDMYDSYAWHMNQQGVWFQMEEDQNFLVNDIMEWAGIPDQVSG